MNIHENEREKNTFQYHMSNTVIFLFAILKNNYFILVFLWYDRKKVFSKNRIAYDFLKNKDVP